MNEYTDFLEGQMSAGGEDESLGHLLGTLKVFRGLPEGLDEFITQYGYDGDIADNRKRLNFSKKSSGRIICLRR